jgi:hypothetical protein
MWCVLLRVATHRAKAVVDREEIMKTEYGEEFGSGKDVERKWEGS